jgi:hypothetical protein
MHECEITSWETDQFDRHFPLIIKLKNIRKHQYINSDIALYLTVIVHIEEISQKPLKD